MLRKLPSYQSKLRACSNANASRRHIPHSTVPCNASGPFKKSPHFAHSSPVRGRRESRHDSQTGTHVNVSMGCAHTRHTTGKRRAKREWGAALAALTAPEKIPRLGAAVVEGKTNPQRINFPTSESQPTKTSIRKPAKQNPVSRASSSRHRPPRQPRKAPTDLAPVSAGSRCNAAPTAPPPNASAAYLRRRLRRCRIRRCQGVPAPRSPTGEYTGHRCSS